MMQSLAEAPRPPVSEAANDKPSAAPISGAAVALSPSLVGSALTLVTRVLPARKAELIGLLTRMGSDIDNAPEMAFNRLTSVHFMRWVVMDGNAPTDPPLLAFESNYDGTLDEHLDDLYLNGARCMHEVYRCCEGYPLAALAPAAPAGRFELGAEQVARAKTYLKSASVEYAAFYVGRRGKSARRIRVEAELRNVIEAFLDARGPDPWRTFSGVGAAYDAIHQHLKAQHAALLDEIARPAPPPPARRTLPVVARLAALALPLLPVLLPLYALLRIKESTDVAETYDVLPEQTRELAEREDFQVQNQLTHLVPLKPGPFRLFTLRLVFYAIDTLARFYYNQGNLGGLSSIHYARWVIIDGGKRLLFFSNYDGSWERYLGDFVDQAHTGLTGVWSNTRGFPKTKNLVQEGAEDEERFKSWTRAHQIQTQLWYSAYKTLTTLNIGNNSAICAGLVSKPAGDEALWRWLSLL